MTVHVLQGERDMASANKSLGRFDLSDIPPAARGVPQIEVTFDIDANGILHVSAKDKATGKEQSIVIKASSGLSDEEIEAMVRDAESNKDADKKFQELVGVRNQADSMIHSTTKSMEELGDDIDADEKASIEKAIEELKAELAGDDKEAIEAKTKTLTDASAKMAERLYAKNGATQEGEAPGAESAEASTGSTAEDVVDAEFEEVKEDKEKG